MAGRRLQRRRPDDGDGAAPPGGGRSIAGISEPRGLRRPGRSAARLSARVRRPAGGVHGRIERLTVMSQDNTFVGSIPELYDRFMGPMLFEPYARELAARFAGFEGD